MTAHMYHEEFAAIALGFSEVCFFCYESYKSATLLDSPQSLLLIKNIADCHYIDVIMTTMASQITSLTVVYSIVYSCADKRKHQSSASLAFVRGIHRGPVNSPHKWPVTRKMFPFDDVIMGFELRHFEIPTKALTCRASLRQQALTWSLKVKRFFMMTPRPMTIFFGCECDDLIQFQFNIISRVWRHYNEMAFVRVHFPFHYY